MDLALALSRRWQTDLEVLGRLVRGRRDANRELPGESERPLHLAATGRW